MKAANTANRISGMINLLLFSYKSKPLISLNLLVRPHLDYCAVRQGVCAGLEAMHYTLEKI